MASLLHFEDKVHHRNLIRAKSTPLLFPRLLCQVLDHLGFLVEPRLERRRDCEDVLTIDRWSRLPRAQHLSPQDVAKDITVDHPAEDTEEPQIAPPAAPAVTPSSPTPPTLTASDGPSTSTPPQQHISISTRDFFAIMDVFRTFSATSASFVAAHIALAERMTPTEVVVAQTTSLLAQNHTILVQMQSHLGLPPISPSVPAQASSTAAADSPPSS